ncbi:hypothetical protein TNIN_84341 [Trichonephila inaurata madagascariensis]|uniref:Uncharacterized protein n=1 Tax=Trichonephila inaurata madagascariensis TaxID=2747483 RepID=A0A8X6WP30_9ARAC|nr:hypothetical protein TNIN_84341 [Trichonephila inaurata madagascariensis]
MFESSIIGSSAWDSDPVQDYGNKGLFFRVQFNCDDNILGEWFNLEESLKKEKPVAPFTPDASVKENAVALFTVNSYGKAKYVPSSRRKRDVLKRQKQIRKGTKDAWDSDPVQDYGNKGLFFRVQFNCDDNILDHDGLVFEELEFFDISDSFVYGILDNNTTSEWFNLEESPPEKEKPVAPFTPDASVKENAVALFTVNSYEVRKHCTAEVVSDLKMLC